MVSTVLTPPAGLLLLAAACLLASPARPFAPSRRRGAAGRTPMTLTRTPSPGLAAGPPPTDGAEEPGDVSRAPSLNGKTVMPARVLAGGLRGHAVPAVYAILSSDYKRGSGEGWEHVQHVSFTRDLGSDLSHFASTRGPDDVAHVRAMSFSYPQRAVMSDFAEGWRARAAGAGGPGGKGGWGAVPRGTEAASEEANAAAAEADGYEFDEDDEDMDDDDLDDYLQMMAESRAATSSPSQPLFVDATPAAAAGGGGDDVVSPFDAGTGAVTPLPPDSDGALDLTPENVDKVLDEVRPYLISDGGNVSVRDVDPDTGNVYLVLEGACGSCASSTVTMKMGIERVLLEKFGSGLGEVVQVEPDEGGAEGGSASELTAGAIQAEVNRMSNAMVAMGAVVRVVGVDPVGVAEIEFRGPNKVRRGLEMALLDVEHCKHVKFVS